MQEFELQKTRKITTMMNYYCYIFHIQTHTFFLILRAYQVNSRATGLDDFSLSLTGIFAFCCWDLLFSLLAVILAVTL